jgi:hypothetical protein
MSPSDLPQVLNALSIVAVFDTAFNRETDGELIKDVAGAALSGVETLLSRGGMEPGEALSLVLEAIRQWADDPEIAQETRRFLREIERETGAPCPLRYRRPEE